MITITYYLPQQCPSTCRGSRTDIKPQSKPDEGCETGNLASTLSFPGYYGSARLTRKEKSCGGGRTHLHKSPREKLFTSMDYLGFSGWEE